MSSLAEARPSGGDRVEERAENVVRVANNGGEQPIFCRVNQRVESMTVGWEVAYRLTVLLMKRSILEQSWAVAKPRHAGVAYNRRSRTVALVTSYREEVGSP